MHPRSMRDAVKRFPLAENQEIEAQEETKQWLPKSQEMFWPIQIATNT